MRLDLDTVSYQIGGRKLIDQVSLRVPSHALVTIVGPNGAGKSTLLRLASGLLTPSFGRVTLDGIDIKNLTPEKLASQRAMLTQNSMVFAPLLVRDVVGAGLRNMATHHVGACVLSALRRVGLDHFVDRNILSLSGGEQQRVHLARVLAQLAAGANAVSQGLLLLDEPISAQDLARQALVLDTATDHVRRGGSALVVLHDLNWAAARADLIVVLQKGRIMATGPPNQVITPEIIKTTFDVASLRIRCHDESNRPFIVPHDMSSMPLMHK